MIDNMSYIVQMFYKMCACQNVNTRLHKMLILTQNVNIVIGLHNLQ